MKRIVLGFDGTWNEPDDNTNVQHFCKSVKHDGRKQLAKYFEGVGTHVHDKISGGLLGKGISDNIKEGYRYLVQQYELGDEIFLVGFSRGAYTARSLVGLIRKVGLLSRSKIEAQRMDISDLDKGLLSDAYALYRRRDPNPDVEDVQAFRKQYSYYDASKENTGEPLDTNPVKIKFLGVWDTVGALGIPMSALSLMGHTDEEIKAIESRQFHDVKLSALVENAFHALAIDEHRKDYEATLWSSEKKPQQHVEQVWFVGAHTDVGGGVEGYPLSKIALAWMQRKAMQCGLELDDSQLVTVTQEDNLAEIYDSFGQFLKGVYAKEHEPYYRNIGTTPENFEAIHESVNFRLNADSQYRPQNKVGHHVSGRREGAREEKL